MVFTLITPVTHGLYLTFDQDNKDNGASWDWDIIFEPAKQRWFSTGMTYDPMPALIHGYRRFEDSPGLYAAKEVFYSVEELDRASETTLRPTVKRTKRTKRTEEPPLEEANSSDSSFSKDEISKVWPSRTNYRRPSHSKKSSTSSTETPSGSSRSKASREVHNNIEKQYRQRLNQRFDSLLASLPKSMVGADVDVVGECSNSTTVTPSKPRVLDLAKMYIDTLETETRNIERDNKGLEKTAKMLETAYRKRGLGSRNYFGEGWETRPRKY